MYIFQRVQNHKLHQKLCLLDEKFIYFKTQNSTLSREQPVSTMWGVIIKGNINIYDKNNHHEKCIEELINTPETKKEINVWYFYMFNITLITIHYNLITGLIYSFSMSDKYVNVEVLNASMIVPYLMQWQLWTNN